MLVTKRDVKTALNHTIEIAHHEWTVGAVSCQKAMTFNAVDGFVVSYSIGDQRITRSLPTMDAAMSRYNDVTADYAAFLIENNVKVGE